MSTFSNKMELILMLLCTLIVTSMIQGCCHEVIKGPIIRPHGLSLREFGYDESTLEYYKRRAMLLDVGTMRVAPQGPDAQHHSQSPTMS